MATTQSSTLSKLFMVLPVYNEENNILPLLSNLEHSFKILAESGHKRSYIIVDDGSTDATDEILKNQQKMLPIDIITHQKNQGLGNTMLDGLQQAAKQAANDDIIFTMDADSTHPADLIIRMCQQITDGNDIIIASRYRRGARVIGLNPLRLLMSYGARALFQTFTPISGVRDYTCGFRAYRAKILKRAFDHFGNRFIEQSNFECMAEILLRLNYMHPKIIEVPMVLRYDLKLSASKMRVGITALNTLKLLIKYHFKSFWGSKS